MALGWNDAKAFRQHLEHMRMFHQMHRSTEGKFTPQTDTPALCNLRLPVKMAKIRLSSSIRGRPSLVPIWTIALPKNSQN